MGNPLQVNIVLQLRVNIKVSLPRCQTVRCTEGANGGPAQYVMFDITIVTSTVVIIIEIDPSIELMCPLELKL